MIADKITIVGAGPAGLFCSYLLLKKGFRVDLYDHSSGPAKKFIVAGSGGLNLTHSEDLSTFASRYGKNEEFFRELLSEFSPTDLREWCAELGIDTFVGSSGRIFPKSFKAAEILSKWLDNLKSNKNFSIYLKHKLIEFSHDKILIFSKDNDQEGEVIVQAHTVILALGGASWKKTGSDGLWSETLKPLGIKLQSFLPMNCGFERQWSDFFKKEVDHSYLKNIELRFEDRSVRGELMLTPYGIEGGAIYALSNHIRDELIAKGTARVTIDLKPDLSVQSIVDKLAKRAKKVTRSNHLRKVLNFDKKHFILLKEILPSPDFEDDEVLAKNIKNLDIELTGIRAIDEAISISGGVCFSELTEFLELRRIPNIYFAGEMLDFEAGTGGYLLQGCFSTGQRVVRGISLKN